MKQETFMDTYCNKLKIKMDQYAHLIYKVTKNFPEEEQFGIISQLRRAALSVILNFIEGYARRKGDNCKVHKNFLEISYGSLKEAKYLVHFSFKEKYLAREDYDILIKLSDEIGAMLYTMIK